MHKPVTGIILKLNGRPNPRGFHPRWERSCNPSVPHRAMVFYKTPRDHGFDRIAMRDGVEFLVYNNGILVDYRTQYEVMLSVSPKDDLIANEMADRGYGYWYEFPVTVVPPFSF